MASRRSLGLDGLRGLAIILVVVDHLGFIHAEGGFVGVDVFFVLSGFLITSLLISERARWGNLSLRRFYARRALRLLPGLLAVVLFAILLSTVLRPDRMPHSVRRETLDGVLPVLFYVGDFVRATGAQTALGILAHTWSLAVEEQFYLIWPFMFLLLARVIRTADATAVLLCGLAGGDMIYRVALLKTGSSPLRVFNSPDTHCDGLLLGCAMAFWLAFHSPDVGRLLRRAVHLGCVLGLAGLLVITATWSPLDYGALEIGIPFAVVTSGLLLWELLLAAPLAPLRWVFESRLAVWLGRRSYGVYLWSYPITRVLVIPESHGTVLALERLAAVGASLVATALSYRFIEEPFLRRKLRFQRTIDLAVPSPADHAAYSEG